MENKIAICRFIPFDLNLKSYNVQELGMAKAFCTKGYDVDLIVFKKSNQSTYELYSNGKNIVTCIELPRTRVFRWGINRAILNEKFWEPYNYIVCFEYMEIMCFWVAKLTGKVILYSGPYYNLFTIKPISPLYDRVVTPIYNNILIGNFTKSVLAQQYLESKGHEKVKTLGVGLDTERFDNDVKIQPSTEELVKYMKEHCCLLYVGAISDRKNFPFLLDVYKKVLEIRSDVKLVLIGKSNVSMIKRVLGYSSERYYNKFVADLSPSEKDGILHIEKIDNNQLRYIYPLAKAFLLPSKLEIFGMVLLEAMYLGAPVISSRNGGSMTLMRHSDTGIMLEDFNSDEWSNAAIKLISDDEYRNKLIRNGKELVTNKYSWEVITNQMLSNIRETNKK